MSATNAPLHDAMAALSAASEQLAAARAAHAHAVRDVTEQVAAFVGRDPEDLVIARGWPCAPSPTGHCVFDEAADPMCDECLFCQQPDERK